MKLSRQTILVLAKAYQEAFSSIRPSLQHGQVFDFQEHALYDFLFEAEVEDRCMSWLRSMRGPGGLKEFISRVSIGESPR